ncbi:MAG: hypothetical protein ACTSO9_02595 [Candidatus Helarchaeota archaeon]
MKNKEKIIEMTINLYNSLKLSEVDKEFIGNLYSKSSLLGNLPEFNEENNHKFLDSILKNEDRYFNPFFFLMASSELLKTIRTTELFSELILNLSLLQFQTNCNHLEDEIIYKKRFSTYFPIYNEKEVTFCDKCFINYFEMKIRDNLPIFTVKDIVGIGVSGEKDSMAALKAIGELKRKSIIKNLNLIVCFIDEGIRGPNGLIPYRENCEENVKRLCKLYKFPLKIYRYRDIFGFTIDDLYKAGLNPCNFDSQLMSIVSKKFAFENKITKSLGILTENESFQFACLTLEGLKFNLTPFSPIQMSKTKISNHKLENFSIMLNIKDEENRLYLKHTKTQYNSSIKCPYNRFNIGKLNSVLVNKMEEIHPGAITNFNNGIIKLSEQLSKTKKIHKTRVKFCPNCNLPSLGGFQKDCVVCKLKKELENKK